MLALPLPEGLVAPAEAGDVIQLAGGGGAGLRMEPIGVGLQAGLPVGAGDRVFVSGEFLQAGDEALPLLALAGQRIGRFIPTVEIAHHGDAFRVGSPDPEGPARFSPLLRWVGAKPKPTVCQLACVVLSRLFLVCHIVYSSHRTPLPAPVRAFPLLLYTNDLPLYIVFIILLW